MKYITEQNSRYDNLERMSTDEILKKINTEDKTIACCVEKALPQIKILTNQVLKKIKNGGRLFYIGSGTSGRLGIVDASECPPTFGVKNNLVIGIIAGGDKAIRNAVEGAEDNFEAGWNDLKKYKVNKKDFVIGISASGTTPYVVGAIQKCEQNKITTGCITSNKNSPLAVESQYPVEVVGPEFITGSSRMKSGTAQKMILNMVSSCVMIKLNKIKGNKMVDMQLKNKKLVERGAGIIKSELKISHNKAKELLLKYGSVRKVLENKK
ncbi:MAG: N-acetylmuramic acid 6-phosphate etherase [Bacteroidales bacterium]|jgi:N-acetylmuramic acid 6-phosphate etherase